MCYNDFIGYYGFAVMMKSLISVGRAIAIDPAIEKKE
jgi:hypothetical protein